VVLVGTMALLLARFPSFILFVLIYGPFCDLCMWWFDDWGSFDSSAAHTFHLFPVSMTALACSPF
jgi:hypothetical protein